MILLVKKFVLYKLLVTNSNYNEKVITLSKYHMPEKFSEKSKRDDYFNESSFFKNFLTRNKIFLLRNAISNNLLATKVYQLIHKNNLWFVS